jgi:integrase
MSTRSHYGQGTVTERRDGRWEARVMLPTGKRKCFYGKTQKEVERKLTEARRNLNIGVGVIADERLTVAAYVAQWLERMRPPRVRFSTHKRYTQLLVHVTRAYGNRRLTSLTPSQVATLYQNLQRPETEGGAGISATTAHHLHVVLHQAVDDAVKLDLLAANPTNRVDAPKLRRAPIQPFTLEEARRLLEAARRDRLEALYVLALTTGMRLGELLALTWRHVDLETGKLQVVASLQRAEKGWTLGEPKTARSRRQIALSPMAVEALRARRTAQFAERLAAGSGWQHADLVFSTTVGTAFDPVNVNRIEYRRMLAKAELPARRFHDLRHTAATLMLLGNVPTKVVSERLGHATIAITLDTYSHVLPDMQRDAADAVEAILRPAVG